MEKKTSKSKFALKSTFTIVALARFSLVRLVRHTSVRLVPRTRTLQFGQRNFHVAAPVVWNSLPTHLGSTSVVNSSEMG